MRIGLAADHHGVERKKELIQFLKQKGYEIVNYGTDSIDMVDYPNYAFRIGEDVVAHKIDFGILMCGTGIGMSIACNKVKGVRCAKVNSVEEARLSREHNDANVIAFSSLLPREEVEKILDIFLSTNFSTLERHGRRIKQISTYEEKYGR